MGGRERQWSAVDYQKKGPGWTSPGFCAGGWERAAIWHRQYYGELLLRGMTFGYDEPANHRLVRWRDYEFYGGTRLRSAVAVTLKYGSPLVYIRAPYLMTTTCSFSRRFTQRETALPAGDPAAAWSWRRALQIRVP